MKPCVNFFLEVEVPDESNSFFVLNRDKYGGPMLLAPDPLPVSPPENAFLYSESLLDGAQLIEGNGIAEAGYVWENFTSTATNIRLDRGIDVVQSVVGRPVAATLTATVIDPNYDALQSAAVGLGKRVRIRAGTELAFMGVLTKLRATYDAAQNPIVELEATDAVARLNSIQMESRPQESYEDRVIAACLAADIGYEVEMGGSTLNQTEEGTTGLLTITAAQDSEGSLVWVDRFNQLHALIRGNDIPEEPEYTFANTHDVENHYCLTAYADSIDTTQVINTLTFRNTSYVEDPNNLGEYIYKNTEYNYSSTNSARYYGVGNALLSTLLDATELPDYAEYIFERFDQPSRKVVNIAYYTDDWKSFDVPEIAFIDIADPIRVVLKDDSGNEFVNAVQRVAGISHVITPENWNTQLKLL